MSEIVAEEVIAESVTGVRAEQCEFALFRLHHIVFQAKA